MLDFDPDISLADEDDEHEEAPQHVAAVNDSEEDLNRFDGLASLTIVVVDDEMDTFNCPEDAKDQEQLQVQNL